MNVHPSTAAYRALKAGGVAAVEYTALSNAAKIVYEGSCKCMTPKILLKTDFFTLSLAHACRVCCQTNPPVFFNLHIRTLLTIFSSLAHAKCHYLSHLRFLFGTVLPICLVESTCHNRLADSEGVIYKYAAVFRVDNENFESKEQSAELNSNS